MIAPLKPDSKRQAVAALEGYVYQLWQSLYAWCQLQGGEALFLEGAEDFDVLLPESARTTQVKKTTERLTLHAKGAVQAINNWWANQQRNPDRRVYLSFLTTADVGREKGNPFGESPGIEYWESAKRPGVSLAPVRAFLTTQQGLAADLRIFAAGLSDDQLRRDVVARISWCTGVPSRAEVRELVAEAVVELAERYFVPPSEARTSVVARLYCRLSEVVLDPSRGALTRADLLDAVEEASTQRMSRREITVLSAGAFAPPAGDALAKGALDLNFEAGNLFVLDALLPRGFATRGELVENLRARLAQFDVLSLKGSTGMGKSSLARLVAAAIGGKWALLDLRGAEAATIGSQLNQALSWLSRNRDVAGLIVDDLNFADQPSVYENTLTRLLHSCRIIHCNVLITSHQTLPSRVVAECALPPLTTIDVPPMGDAEVRDVLAQHGCPSSAAENWAKVVLAKTLGHPQLVHARIRRLESERWPSSPEAFLASLQESADLNQVQREARQRLAEELPGEARSLAYRLAVLTSRFTRSLALAIAKPEAAGELFDRLVGPWVEGPVGDFFTLSPLLRGDPAEVLGEAGVMAVRREICDAILSRSKLAATEFVELVFQAFLASYEAALVRAVFASWTLPDEAAPLLARMQWLSLIKVAPGEELWPGNPITSLLLRDLQFRIAAVTDTEQAERVLRAWDAEWVHISTTLPKQGFALIRSQFLLRALFTFEFPLASQQAVEYMSELLSLYRAHPELVPPSMADMATSMVDGLLLRLRGPERVADFLAALEGVEPSIAEPILEILRSDAAHAVSIMLSLYETPPPTLPSEAALTKAIDSATRLGESRKVPSLVAAAYRSRAILDHEYRNDSSAALAHLDAGVAVLAGEPPELAEYRATLLAAMNRHEEALAIWRPLLASWKGPEAVRASGARWAAISASKLGDHAGAAELFHLAEGLATEMHSAPQRVAFIGDRALALWRAGFKERALTALAEALAAVETLPDPKTDLRSRTLHKLLGHAILWMFKQSPQTGFSRQEVAEPPPGRFSQRELNEEMRGLPLLPPGDNWAFLLALSIDLDCEAVARDLEGRRTPAPSALGAFQLTSARVRQAIRKPLGARAVPLSVSLHAAYEAAKRTRDAAQSSGKADEVIGRPLEERGEFVAEVVSCCVVALAREPSALLEALNQWQQDLAPSGLGGTALERLLQKVRQLSIDGESPIGTANDGAATRASRLAAASLVLARDHSVEELFVATALLVQGFQQHLWRGAIEGQLEHLVVDAWKRIVTEARFALRSPSTTVPRIESACSGLSRGLVKCAQVLVAAGSGVSTRLPAELWAAIERVATGEDAQKA